MGRSDVILGKVTPGSKSSGSHWFSSDIVVPKSGRMQLQIAVANAMTLEYTLDGTNYVKGDSIASEEGKELFLSVTQGDAFNLQQSSGGSVTVRWARVHIDS
ncbi:MAG: hypothetical protein MN733_44330 [Nitrososphaera sp.]|nr:hypothetical protein [Nitrososphaera sp.]